MVGTTIFFFLFIAQRRGLVSLKVKKRQLLFLMILGVCATALNGSLIWAVSLSTASQVSLLVRSDVLFSVLLGIVFFGERLSRSGLAGLLVMGTGAFLVLEIFPWELQVASVGDLLAILAGFLLSTNAIIIKYYLADLPSEVIIFYNAAIMTFLSFTIILFTSKLETFVVLAAPIPLILSGLAVFLSSTMFLFYYWSLAEHPVWAVRAFLLLSPFVTILLALWLLGEPVRASQWMGGVLLFMGGVLILRDLEIQPILAEMELQK